MQLIGFELVRRQLHVRERIEISRLREHEGVEDKGRQYGCSGDTTRSKASTLDLRKRPHIDDVSDVEEMKSGGLMKKLLNSESSLVLSGLSQSRSQSSL